MEHVLRCSGYDLITSSMVRAVGCTFYDESDRAYIDFESGVWCAGLGHGHPDVSEAIRRQMDAITHIGYRYSSGTVERGAAAVLSTLGPRYDDGKCVFLSSGSEAVEFAVQAARKVVDKPLFLALDDAYLSAYGSSGRRDPREWTRVDWTPCAQCADDDPCDPDCSVLRRIPFGRIAAFAFEPGNSGGLVRLPPHKLIQALSSRVTEQGGLIVIDEVTTGFGRTGAWYGHEHYGLHPDVVAMGKGLGNGYPVSAVAMTGDAAQRLTASGFHYAQSHQNDPLACTVAATVIDAIRRQGLVQRSREIGAAFLSSLRDLATKHTAVCDVRGRGLMIAIELRQDVGPLSAAAVCRQLFERGFLVGCKPQNRLLRFYPPLIIEARDLSRLIDALDAILTSGAANPSGS